MRFKKGGAKIIEGRFRTTAVSCALSTKSMSLFLHCRRRIQVQPPPNYSTRLSMPSKKLEIFSIVCDEKFFSELTKEASEISRCFATRVRRLLHLHISTRNDQPLRIVQMLVEYATMNVNAMTKILNKYDKVHSFVNGIKFYSRIQGDHMEHLQSPWLIELGAFCINFNGSNEGEPNRYSDQFSYDFSSDQATLRFAVSDSVKLDYSLTCPICLETVICVVHLSSIHWSADCDICLWLLNKSYEDVFIWKKGYYEDDYAPSVAELIGFQRCMHSCLENLEAVPWVGDEEEEKVPYKEVALVVATAPSRKLLQFNPLSPESELKVARFMAGARDSVVNAGNKIADVAKSAWNGMKNVAKSFWPF
ncbi:hypothetical protein Syun_003340 [Stephania yunnanensis]|uniref:Uncharacterized protein n=1 Tax=Stephania yunnanensis TaxID=152371 RepID=A0AAP0L2I4_9MAGN